MLDDALHRVALDVLDDGHLGLVTILDGEQGVGVTQSQSGLLHRQLHEGRILAAGVNGSRDEVRDAHAAGSTLAELGTSSTFKSDGGSHNQYLLDTSFLCFGAPTSRIKNPRSFISYAKSITEAEPPSPRQQLSSIHGALTFPCNQRSKVHKTRTMRKPTYNRSQTSTNQW